MSIVHVHLSTCAQHTTDATVLLLNVAKEKKKKMTQMAIFLPRKKFKKCREDY
jgi:hypothetical protein